MKPMTPVADGIYLDQHDDNYDDGDDEFFIAIQATGNRSHFPPIHA